jgi:hypothetical protein
MSLPKLPEPEAFRCEFDGYGWLYRDNGSGSIWRDVQATDKEFMFTETQLIALQAATVEACAEMCNERADKCAEAILAMLKEKAAKADLTDPTRLERQRILKIVDARIALEQGREGVSALQYLRDLI